VFQQHGAQGKHDQQSGKLADSKGNFTHDLPELAGSRTRGSAHATVSGMPALWCIFLSPAACSSLIRRVGDSALKVKVIKERLNRRSARGISNMNADYGANEKRDAETQLAFVDRMLCHIFECLFQTSANGDDAGAGGPDSIAFDDGYAFTPNGQDGTITMVGETSPGKFEAVATFPMAPRARIIGADQVQHKLYVPAAEYGAGPATGPGRAPALIDTFNVVVSDPPSAGSC
jgi:hypothetical protein